MVNRYSNAQTYQGNLYTPPLDLIGKSLQYFQGQYDRNYELANTIKNNFIQSLPQDRAVANEMQRDYEKRIDEIVAKYGSDYSKASNELNNLTYSIKKDYGPGGKAGAIIGNYNNYVDWRKTQQELVEKGKALGEDLNMADSYFMNEYKGIGNFDPITGAYNRFNADQLTEYVDPDSIVQDVYKNFKPEKYKVGRTEFKNGLQTYREEEVDGISANRLHPSFTTALSNNPKYRAYLQQQAKLRGIPSDQIEQYVDGYARQRATDLSYVNKSDISKSERDPLMLVRERARYRKQEQQDFFNQFDNYQYDPTTEVTTRKESTLGKDGDWRSAYNTGSTSGIPIGPPGSGIFSVQPNLGQSASHKTFKQALNDPTYVSETGINKNLAAQIFEDKRSEYVKTGQSDTFNKKYGVDKKWTEEFDKSVAVAYKAEEANHSRVESKSIKIVSPQARTNVLKDIAGQLADPTQISVYVPGKGGIQTAKAAGLTREALVDENGKLKYSDVAYVQPGRGNPRAGYRVTTDKGTFVVVDTNTDRYNASTQIQQGMSPIFDEDKTVGNPMIIGQREMNGVVVNQYGVPEIKYEKNKSGGYDENMYMNYIDETGNITGKTKIGMEDIYKQYAPVFQNALNAGATKKEMTMFQLFPGYNDEDE